MEYEVNTGFVFYDENEEFNIPIARDNTGTPCPYFILKGGIFKRFAAYTSMKLDLNDCVHSIQFLEHLNKEQPNTEQIIKTSLLFASIVRYARCFNDAEGRGTTLNARDVFEGSHLNLIDFHEKTIDLRNKYLAHAGKSEHESRGMVVILNHDFSHKVPKEYRALIYRLMDDDSNLSSYHSLYKFVVSHVEDKVSELSSLMDREVNKISHAELKSNSNIPNESGIKEVRNKGGAETIHPKIKTKLKYKDEEMNLEVAIRTINGKQCPYYFFKGKIPKYVSAFNSIGIETERCIDTVTLLSLFHQNPDVPQEIKDALFISSIFRYAKCFRTNGQRAALTPKSIFSGVNKKFKNLHEKLMKIRNTKLAHVGIRANEVRSFVLHLNPDLNNKKVVGFEYRETEIESLDVDYKEFIELLNVVWSHIDLKVSRVNQLLLGNDISIDNLYLNSKTPDSSNI